MTPEDFWYSLKKSRHLLTLHQHKTIKGLAIKGDIEGANKGLRKILKRRNG